MINPYLTVVLASGPAVVAIASYWIRDRSRQRLHCALAKALRNGGTVTEQSISSQWQICVPPPTDTAPPPPAQTTAEALGCKASPGRARGHWPWFFPLTE